VYADSTPWQDDLITAIHPKYADPNTEAKHAQSLAADWKQVLDECASHSSDKQQTAQRLLDTVVPSLVDGLCALCRTMEDEASRMAAHERLRRKTPSIPARPPFNPLLWLASYLMRHHPQSKLPVGNSTAASYAAALQTVLNEAKTSPPVSTTMNNVAPARPSPSTTAESHVASRSTSKYDR